MKCHYEVLSLPRDADEGAIKTAYKKLALRFHPDKNPDDQEAAKEQFQLVQQAYEVLSDPQERAWYDNHRDEILKGKHTDYEEECLDVFQYFTTSCFRGFDPSEPKNFYAVYADVFSQIFAEDLEYMSEEEAESIPVFGDASSDYETVVREFYAYAESYSTKKSYAWLFPHNVAEIKHRKICKILDKENKKIQLKARKERNEEVRNLVAFVKKRDRRVQAYKKVLEERAELNRLKTQQEQLNQIRRRNQELEEAVKRQGDHLNEGYEDQLKQLESAYSDMYLEEDDDEPDEDEFDEELFCEPCNRLFKDEGSYKNHLSTKKHRNNVMLFSIQVENEEENGEEDLEGVSENGEEAGGQIEEEEEEAPSKSRSKKSKSKAKKAAVEEESEEEVLKVAASDDDDDDWGTDKKGKKGAKSKKGKASKSKVEAKAEVQPKVEKKPEKKPEKPKEQEMDTDHMCATCKNSFPSKNKLFDHLKKTNHSIYLPKGKR